MRVWHLLVGLVTVALLASGCALIAPQPELSPQEVVSEFYRWYIGYPANPLVDRAYRESPYLAESFVQTVDEALAGEFMADPILLAQDIPSRYSLERAEVDGDEATVTVNFYWGESSTPTPREVRLRLIDGQWKITQVSMVES